METTGHDGRFKESCEGFRLFSRRRTNSHEHRDETRGGSQAPYPTDSELAQCEAEVAVLLKIIGELNAKMGSLQVPREEDESRSSPDCDSGAPQLCSSDGEVGLSPARSVTLAKRDDTGDLWSELEKVLSALECSVGTRSSVPAQTTQDLEKETEHLTAARNSWVKVTLVLEEMEREFGFSYCSALPPVERQQYQRDVLVLYEHNVQLRASLQGRQEELATSEGALRELEDEKKKLQEKLLSLKRRWFVGSGPSLPCSPSSSSSGGMSPFWASPPFPGSPLLPRRPTSAFSTSSTGGDTSPSCPSPVMPGSPSLETEVERLQRCLERLKARNERLTAALERRKGESEQISMTLSRHEADHSALQMALRYCEECEETYQDLLNLYEVKRAAGQEQPGSGAGPGSTERGAAEQVTSSHARLMAVDFEGQVMAAQDKIDRLKRNRAAVRIPEPSPEGAGKLSPDTGTLAGPRRHSVSQSSREDKAALLYELVTVREEMSELRGAVQLLEKQRRCLDWTLVVQKAQDAAGALILDNLREELEDRNVQQQRAAKSGARPSSVEGSPVQRNRAILRELQAVLQREQLLRRRAAAIRDALDCQLSDSSSQRRLSEEEVARLSLAHSKITAAYRNARRKHREQLWRLEKQVAVVSERHVAQITELRATLDKLEGRREETVL
ncbi:colorectal mutant cancer protein isoform X1 [Denticeps clupeoides]|uniref:colorectal mutant cancer protein isoform X1 n=2 Tax=Denticeps clupeoides TaxID=299321 RepID=UPI0010A2ED66|nr:colorectal mutant cancer protein-like isoform X1 [Denticeps clupeoides]